MKSIKKCFSRILNIVLKLILNILKENYEI